MAPSTDTVVFGGKIKQEDGASANGVADLERIQAASAEKNKQLRNKYHRKKELKAVAVASDPHEALSEQIIGKVVKSQKREWGIGRKAKKKKENAGKMTQEPSDSCKGTMKKPQAESPQFLQPKPIFWSSPQKTLSLLTEPLSPEMQRRIDERVEAGERARLLEASSQWFDDNADPMQQWTAFQPIEEFQPEFQSLEDIELPPTPIGEPSLGMPGHIRTAYGYRPLTPPGCDSATVPGVYWDGEWYRPVTPSREPSKRFPGYIRQSDGTYSGPYK